jgi:hypothetical protein
MVAPQGFEPRSSESESLVLPLNERAIRCRRILRRDEMWEALCASQPTLRVYEELPLKSNAAGSLALLQRCSAQPSKAAC